MASERRWRLVFIATLIAFAASCLLWIVLNQAPISSDSIDLTLYSRLAQMWLRDPSVEGMLRLITVYGYDPPLFFLLEGALFEIFGYSPKILWIVSMVWALGTLAILGRWCRQVTSSWAPAALAVLFVATSPGFLIFSKLPLRQMPTAFFVVLTASLLFRRNPLGTWRRCLALGLAFSLGALVKLYFPLLMVVPTLLVVAWLVAGGIRRKDLAPLRGALLSLLVVLVLAVPYYGYRLTTIFGHSVTEELGQSAGPNAPWTEFATFYLVALYQTYFLLPLTAVGLLAVVSALRLRLAHRVLVWGLLPGLVIFSHIQHKDARFMLPLVPMFGFLVGLGLAHIKGRLVRSVATAALALFGVWHLGVFPFLPNAGPAPLPLAYVGITQPVPPGGIRAPLQVTTDSSEHRRFARWLKTTVISQSGSNGLLAVTGGPRAADRMVANLMYIYYCDLKILPYTLMFKPGEVENPGPQVWINDYLDSALIGVLLDADRVPFEYLLLPWPVDKIPDRVPQYGNWARMIDPLFAADPKTARRVRSRLSESYRLYRIYRDPLGDPVVFLYRRKKS
jgi:hypothetical protein